MNGKDKIGKRNKEPEKKRKEEIQKRISEGNDRVTKRKGKKMKW